MTDDDVTPREGIETALVHVPSKTGHDFYAHEILGTSRTRQRCRKCHAWKDKAGPECKGDMPEVDPVVELRKYIVRNVSDTVLVKALHEFLSGYEGDLEDESPAQTAGAVCGGHATADLALGDKLTYIVENFPLQMQRVGDTVEMIVKGHASVKAKTVVRAIDELHDAVKPACPNCGHKDYRFLNGTFRHNFNPRDCNLCAPRV